MLSQTCLAGDSAPGCGGMKASLSLPAWHPVAQPELLILVPPPLWPSSQRTWLWQNGISRKSPHQSSLKHKISGDQGLNAFYPATHWLRDLEEVRYLLRALAEEGFDWGDLASCPVSTP